MAGDSKNNNSSEGKKAKPLTPVERLQELSLIQKVSQEMQRQMQVNERTVAEFFIACTETVIKKLLKQQAATSKSNSYSNYSSIVDVLDAAKTLRTDLVDQGASPNNLTLSFCSFMVEAVQETSPRIQRFLKKLAEKYSSSSNNNQKGSNTQQHHVLSTMEMSERKQQLGGIFPGLARPNLIHSVPAPDDFVEHSAQDPDHRKRPPSATAQQKQQPEKDPSWNRKDKNVAPPVSSSSSSPGRHDVRGGKRPISNLPAWMTKSNQEEMDGAPSNKRARTDEDSVQLYGIYQGTIQKLLDFGMVVDLSPPAPSTNRNGGGNVPQQPSQEGMVYNAHVTKNRVDHPSQAGFRRGQRVWVKVISLRNGKILLSTKDVDQRTGEDLMPHRSLAAAEASTGGNYGDGVARKDDTATNVVHPGLDIQALKRREAEEEASRMLNSHMMAGGNSGNDYYGPASSNSYSNKSGSQATVRRAKQLTEHELFEAQQLIRSGVLPVDQYPTFDSEGGMGMLAVEDTEEETEVELAEVEPAFLKGQTRRSGRDLEPVRIIKNPDGSLQRAAMQQTSLAKERRELRQAQANQLMDSIPKDLNRPWEDPLPEAGERHFAQELRSINMSAFDGAPEWKKKAENKTLSYGIISNKSIKEQRESLPVYRLKKQLLEAIAKNQILVVVGETGSGKTVSWTEWWCVLVDSCFFESSC